MNYGVIVANEECNYENRFDSLSDVRFLKPSRVDY